MANPEKPGQWRRYADTFIAGVESQGGTVMVDSGPEAVERLESLMPGSHYIVATFASETDVQSAWSVLAGDLTDLQEQCEPVNVMALSGLAEGDALRLTKDSVAA